MRKILFCCIVVTCLAAMWSCKDNKNNNDVLSKRIDAFADLECQAMTLKDKRFALANEIRFAQDTLLKVASKADTSRLQLKLAVLNKEKETIVQASLALADSIHAQMEDLMLNTFKDKKDKPVFDTMLAAALKKRGCQ